MHPLPTAQHAIATMLARKGNTLSSLEATFATVELMSEADANAALDALIEQRWLDRDNADMAQMLSQKVGRAVRWRHLTLSANEWHEGRG